MMAKKLHIAENLTLPVDAVTQTFGIFAKRGVGKTHAASVMAEEMLKVGQPIVVYDPTSAWWGLKSSKDGKRPGYPVVIFGGEHADVPMEENAGATIAKVIVSKRIPAILDCGLLRKNARIRFMADFCETLYHENRQALHFFVDEAQTIAPNVIWKNDADVPRLVGAMEDIQLQGRRRGLGMTLISPRPALVNVSIRSACEVVMAMQIVQPHDRKAIKEWVDVHGDDAERGEQMMEGIAKQKRGQAWVWSPTWLDLFKQITFRDRETFDSSATPTVGRRIVSPKRMASIDVKVLGEQIAATVERVKSEDPKALKKRIVELESQLANAAKSKPVVAAVPTVKMQRVEVPMLKPSELKLLNVVADRLKKIDVGPILKTFEGATSKFNQILARVGPSAIANGKHVAVAKPAHVQPEVTKPSRVVAAPKPKPAAVASDCERVVDVTGESGRRRLMIGIAQFPEGITDRRLSILADISQGGGTWRTYMAELRGAGYCVSGTGKSRVTTATSAGIAALGEFDPLPTGDKLRIYWQNKFGNDTGKRRIFDVVCAAYPESIAKEEVSAAADVELGGGTWRTYMAELRGLELISGSADLKACDDLFD